MVYFDYGPNTIQILFNPYYEMNYDRESNPER